MQVPHRNEHGDSVAYVIEGPAKSVLFLPDIDRWDTWDRDVREACIAALGLYLFVTQCLTAKRPFMNLGILRDRNYSVGLLLVFLFGMLNFDLTKGDPEMTFACITIDRKTVYKLTLKASQLTAK